MRKHYVSALFYTSIFICQAVALADTAAHAWDVQAALDAHGYPAAQFTLALAWVETANDGSEIHGAHLLALDGSPASDVYFDAQENLLNQEQWMLLGIHAKNWKPRVIEKEAEHTSAAPAKAGSVVVPAAPGTPAAVEMQLPPIDPVALQSEDEADAAKGAARIGAIQELGQPVEVSASAASDGNWIALPDTSRLWKLQFYAGHDLGLRFHFQHLALPDGVSLLLYNPGDPTEIHGPFKSGDDFWTPTIFSAAAVLECHVPAGVDASALHIVLDKVVQNYRDVGALAKAAGTCNNDVTCYTEWLDASKGVGGLGTVGDTGSLFCTGSLIADTDPATTIPYLLTANHCVGGSSDANSLEVYWLYQTSTCNGTPPNIRTVPRTTGGADFLAGNNATTGSDFAFLRLRQSPAAGVTYLGFTTDVMAVGTTTAVIHHPLGDYKRISFGTLINTGSPSEGAHVQPLSRFHENLWQSGTTEPGSSGSPLFKRDTEKVIGQLWGGLASCTARNEPDYFGRFDVTFPLIESYLIVQSSPFDVNQSGSVNSADLQLVINAALDKSSLADPADLDHSGAVDAVDIQLINNALLQGAR